jgi:3'-phosphoadenosine 5'-phosphosulfate sulfotransferase (PAPS reductase)/FAD synthetase
MNDPFKIIEPTIVSFSGGRTSAYMLWRVLQSNNGLPDEAIVCFANTGKEDEETLKFVHACATRWQVPITWLEFRDSEPKFEVVNFETASRNGEPFEALIKKKNYLPNPIARFCTVDLKILTFERYLKSIGWDDWENMIGIRADEPRRVAKIRSNPSDGRKGVHRTMPLATEGISKFDVMKFWKSQDFDLGLPNMNGTTYHGNCDLCFLKGYRQTLSLIQEKPERAIWWAKMEGSITNAHIKDGGTFRKDRPTYAQMMNYNDVQGDMFADDDEGIACFCGE